jgi:acetoin utilization deacetylase AcuC-like enzyme
MIAAYYHPGYAAPIGDRHVMPMHKFALVAAELRTNGGVTLEEPAPLSIHDLLRVHTPDYVDAVRTGVPRELAESQKFPWTPQLYPSVLLTCGGCFAAAERALRDGVGAALVSGFHHAHADHGEGFCTFNGLVVAAEALRAAGEIATIAVFDMDLHYGNGTAALATSRPWLVNVSLYGNDYHANKTYPDVSVLHHADGANHRSIALPNGCRRDGMLAAMEQGLPLLLEHGKPDLLLYQAGADPYREDPYSPLDLDHDDLRERDRLVFEFARAESLPIAWVLAGGYTEDTRKVVQVHLNTFDAALEVYGAA